MDVNDSHCFLEYNSMGYLKSYVQYPYKSLHSCNKKKCTNGQFFCSQLKFCISIELVCDGINHCIYNEDELECHDFTYKNLYKCRNQKKGILLKKVCNEIVDCLFDDDELFCFKNISISNSNCKISNFIQMNCTSLNSKTKIYHINKIEENFKNLYIQYSNVQLNIKSVHTQIRYLSIIDNNNNKNILKILKYFPNLVTLILNYNKIKFQNEIKYIFQKLQYLDLSFNKINNSNWLKSFNSPFLIHLDLSGNPLNTLSSDFQFLPQLQILKLTKCPILKLNKVFFYLKYLKELHLNDTKELIISTSNTLTNLKDIQQVFSKSYRFCCLLWKYSNKSLFCQPDSTLYSSCSNLLSSFLVRFLFWFIGVTGLLSNIFSTILTLKTPSFIKLYKFLILLCDSMVSIYFLIIAIVDAYFNNIYMENDKSWRESHFCGFIGTCFQFALTLSIMTVLLLTMERSHAVINPLKHSKIKKWRSLSILLSCLFSITWSILPNFIYNVYIFLNYIYSKKHF